MATGELIVAPRGGERYGRQGSGAYGSKCKQCYRELFQQKQRRSQ